MASDPTGLIGVCIDVLEDELRDAGIDTSFLRIIDEKDPRRWSRSDVGGRIICAVLREARGIPEDDEPPEALTWDESAEVVWKVLKGCWRHGSKVGRLSECPEAVEAVGVRLMERFRTNPGIEPGAPEFHSPDLLRAAEDVVLAKKEG